MGMIGRLVGGPQAVVALGQAAGDLAQVLTPHATRRMELSAAAARAALDQHGAEFAQMRDGWFDQAVNGLNRLPRPMLALGTLGLFVFAMADPDAFAHRMRGLAEVPEPLWWLLGAIVAFYFGARETHYFRTRPQVALLAGDTGPSADNPERPVTGGGDNPALDLWTARAGDR
ncbi:MAG: holin family protein [Gemmobacter sp.]